MNKPAPLPLKPLPIVEGCTVEFNGRGQKLTGVVVRIRARVRRKMRELNEAMSILTGGNVTGIPEATTVVEVVPPGPKKVVWTVPIHSCKRIAAPEPAAHQAAYDVKQAIQGHNAAIQAQRGDVHREACERNGLLGLKAGDSVWVQYPIAGYKHHIKWLAAVGLLHYF